MTKTSDEDRFWAKVDRRGPDECWPWLRAKNPYGYGSHSIGSRRGIGSHRVAYELLVGPIPAGLQIDHLCKNRACCNPAHMEAVTLVENVLRGDSLPAQWRRATHCACGLPYVPTPWKNSAKKKYCPPCTARAQRERKARRKETA